MKKLINLTILFTTILSLTFIHAIPTNAASKINITYYAGNGYFKAKPNRNKNKITIKNKLNKKRGYAPAIRRDGYTFDGWYTKKKGGKKFIHRTDPHQCGKRNRRCHSKGRTGRGKGG